MKKVKAIFLAVFTLVPFTGLSFFIYYFFPTTPALIVVLVLLMAGVMLAFYVYTKKVKEETIGIDKADNLDFPPIERGLIYVSPANFCDKLEKFKGQLFIAGTDKIEEDITLIKGEYHKLTDEMALFYTNGIKTIFRGIEKIAVGNNQFVIFQFKDLMRIRNQKKIALQMSKKRLLVHERTETTEFKIKGNAPVYVFDWNND